MVSEDRSEVEGWRFSVMLSRAAFEALEPAFADHADAVVAETIAAAHPARDAPSDALRATAFVAAAPADDTRLVRLLALLRANGVASDDEIIEPVRPADWAAQSLASFPSFSVGRFSIHGGHQSLPRRRFALLVDAGAAFGSGRHETTKGCLRALDWLARRRRVGRAFDIGTGTGILAVAAARLWPAARIVALDNDPMAVAAARETVRRNALSRRVSAAQGTGFRTRPATRLGRADLICANIRAQPIAAMAPTFARHLRPSSAVVLSGLLVTEEPLVLAAFRAVRLRLRHRIVVGCWATMILTP